MAYFGSMEFFSEKRKSWLATRVKARQQRAEGKFNDAARYEGMATEQKAAIMDAFYTQKKYRESGRPYRKGF